MMPVPRVAIRAKKITKHNGRRHIPNDDSRQIIANMSAYGFSVAQMMQFTGMSSSVLYEHYGYELKTAKIGKDLAVLDSAYLQAVGGPKKEWDKAKFPATKAYLEKRGIWQADVLNVGTVAPDLSKLSDEDLATYNRLLQATDPRRLGVDEEVGRSRDPETEE